MADSEPVAVGNYPAVGIRIEYFEAPYRSYAINGTRVPSVTTVLGILNKKALPHWAAKVTVEGCWKLTQRKGYSIPDAPWKLKEDLRRFGYDHESVTRAAATRGVNVHQVLQDWAEQQKIPAVSDFPEGQRGYVRGLAKWLMEQQPRFVESELIVGSAVHGFAGRRDTVAIVETQDRGRCLLDLKTSKAVYPASHFPQLAAYELAGVECGEQPTDSQGIVRVGVDGTYEVAWSDATAEDFLAVLAAYKSQEKWNRKPRRAR